MKKWISTIIVIVIVFVGVFYVGPIVWDMISGEGGISIDVSSIPIISDWFGGPPTEFPEQATEAPGVTVQEIEEGPVEVPLPAQPTPLPPATRVPSTSVPVGERIDSVVETSVGILEGGQTVVQEIGQTRKVTEDAAGFPICTGAVVLLFGGLVIKLIINLFNKLYQNAERLFTGKVLTSMFAMLVTAGLLSFQAYHSYKTQGLSYVNSTILSIAPWAILMIIWDQLFHKGIWEKIRFEIGGIRPLILFSRMVEILLTGVYAIGGGLDLMVQIGQGIAKLPAVGNLLSQPIISIAQSQSQVQAAASAQSWFQSTAATDALLGLLAVFVLVFVVMTEGGGFYGGGYSEPPAGAGGD